MLKFAIFTSFSVSLSLLGVKSELYSAPREAICYRFAFNIDEDLDISRVLLFLTSSLVPVFVGHFISTVLHIAVGYVCTLVKCHEICFVVCFKEFEIALKYE